MDSQDTNAAEELFHHYVPVQLRFSDVDQFGHVNNSVYFSLYDLAKTQYLMDVLGMDILKEWAVVVANINADFISPVFYQEKIAIQTKVIHLGTKSLSLLQRAIDTNSGSIKCQCKTVMVAFNLKTGQSVEIPEVFKEKFKAFEEGNT